MSEHSLWLAEAQTQHVIQVGKQRTSNKHSARHWSSCSDCRDTCKSPSLPPASFATVQPRRIPTGSSFSTTRSMTTSPTRSGTCLLLTTNETTLNQPTNEHKRQCLSVNDSDGSWSRLAAKIRSSPPQRPTFEPQNESAPREQPGKNRSWQFLCVPFFPPQPSQDVQDLETTTQCTRMSQAVEPMPCRRHG